MTVDANRVSDERLRVLIEDLEGDTGSIPISVVLLRNLVTELLSLRQSHSTGAVAGASGEWHRADSERSILLYTLKQDGWRKGEPAMVNDLMVRIENAPHSDHDLGPIADQILSSLNGAKP